MRNVPTLLVRLTSRQHIAHMLLLCIVITGHGDRARSHLRRPTIHVRDGERGTDPRSLLASEPEIVAQADPRSSSPWARQRIRVRGKAVAALLAWLASGTTIQHVHISCYDLSASVAWRSLQHGTVLLEEVDANVQA
jgi:hypothetical protein